MRTFHNRKRCSVLIFSLALGMMVLFAQVRNAPAGDETDTGRDLFILGNQAYAKGDYDQAILHYNAIMDRDGYAPSLLYNLGNAYYMKKEFGQSILNYERALYLDPGNADISANLALAEKNAGLIMPSQTFWKVFFNRMTLNGWAWMALYRPLRFFTDGPPSWNAPGHFSRDCIKNDGFHLFPLFSNGRRRHCGTIPNPGQGGHYR